MAIENRLTNFLNSRKWIIPTLFGLMCYFFVSVIVAVEIRGLSNLEPTFAFSIGGEMCAMAMSIVITISILPAYKRQSGYVRIFVTLLTIGSSALHLDSFQMLLDGIPELIALNRVVCILVFLDETIFAFFFWIFVTHALKSEGKTIGILNMIASILMLVFVLLPFVNFFYPLYFRIHETGIYERNHMTWWICRIYIFVLVIFVIIAIFLSKESKKKKVIILFFIGLPLIALGMGGYKYGVSLLYTAMMVSLVMMYAFLFSDNEKILYSTNKELGLATNIQKHMLPSIFPAFPEKREFDIYASMDPAKEVGGDFYDFFLVDETHLGLVMADVSDKGVPAALFMMASKIMVQNYAMMGYSPKEVLTKVNQQICSNNQDEMFVTVWLGILDLKTGVLTASNAGHERPIIKKPNGDFEIFNDKHGFVVGWLPTSKYTDYRIQLQKGSKIFVYTDGVLEARGKSGQFGMERTLTSLNNHKDSSSEEICQNLLNDIEVFRGSTNQFDDVTMLCVEYIGSNSEAYEVTIPADVKHLPNAIDPVVKFLEELEVEHKTVYKVQLCLDEILTNVASYAYQADKGEIHVRYELINSPERMIEITVTDEGKYFNPIDTKDPDLTASIEDRKIGGLGLFIVKKNMDEVTYDRKNDKNILTMRKKI